MPRLPELNTNPGSNYRPQAPSAQVAGAPGKALAGLAMDVQRASGVVGDVAQDIQKRNDNGARNRARILFQQAKTKHREFQLQEPDEKKWGQNLDDHIAKAKEDAFDYDMSPFMRQELEQQFGLWTADEKAANALDAVRNETQRNRQIYTDTLEGYKRANDYDSARQVITEATGTVLHPSEAEAEFKALAQEQKWSDEREKLKLLELGVREDPIMGMEMLSAKGSDGEYLNDKWLTEPQRRDLMKKAERAYEFERQSEFKGLEEGIEIGDITPDQIDTIPEFLTDADKRALHKHHERTAPPTAEEDASYWSMIAKLKESYNDPGISREDYAKEHHEVKMEVIQGMPTDYRGDLKKALNYISPGNKFNKGNPDALNKPQLEAAEMEGFSILGAAYDDGVFGALRDAEGKALPKLEQEKAAQAHRDSKRAFAGWLAENPTASVTEARDKATEMISHGVKAPSAAERMQRALPGSGGSLRINRNEASDALLPPKDQLNQFLNE